MSTILVGEQIRRDDQGITIYGVQCAPCGDKYWRVSGRAVLAKVTSEITMSIIRACIATTVGIKRDALLAQVQLPAHKAGILYLKGVITDNHLKKAVVKDDHIDIPDVDIEGRSLTIRILKTAKCSVATATKQGVILVGMPAPKYSATQ